METVTWVLEGALVHQDSTGHSGIICPGLAQRMTAGPGVLHSEKNDSWTLTGDAEHANPVHFVQMWVLPDTANAVPGYEQLDVNAQLAQGVTTEAQGAEVLMWEMDASSHFGCATSTVFKSRCAHVHRLARRSSDARRGSG
ncbi:pirin family protein [Streptomyces flaveolus]